MIKGRRYFVIGCHVLWREISYFASFSNNIYNFKFLKQGLHDTPDLLRKELQQAIDEVDGEYDAILIGYGLCSNGIAGITSKKTRLVVIRGHDCITFLLGSKEYYKSYFDGHPGTIWYSPGWIDTRIQMNKEDYEQTLKNYIEKYGEENGEYLMEMELGWYKAYSNAAYVDQGFMDTTNYKKYAMDCAEWLNWNYDELSGDPRLIIDFLAGNWNNEDFLIVEPGQEITATNDESIINAVKYEEITT